MKRFRFKSLAVIAVFPVLLVSVLALSTTVAAASWAMAWGPNESGQLGIGQFSMAEDTPNFVDASTALKEALAVATSGFHSLAIAPNGSVWTWGKNGPGGQLGEGTTKNQEKPKPVQSLAGTFTQVAAGYGLQGQTSFALRNDGTVWWWGDQYGGISQFPVQFSLPGAVKAISAGDLHALAIRASDGAVFAWGRNGNAQLGDGTHNDSPNAAVKVVGLSGIVAVAAGVSTSFALDGAGHVWGWGGSNLTPVQITTLVGTYVAIAASAGSPSLNLPAAHFLALRSDKTVWAFGANDHGQLGDGTTTPTISAKQVPGLTGIKAIAAGRGFSLALDSSGEVWAWGANDVGQLGDGSFSERHQPVAISTFKNTPVLVANIIARGITAGGQVGMAISDAITYQALSATLKMGGMKKVVVGPIDTSASPFVSADATGPFIAIPITSSSGGLCTDDCYVQITFVPPSDAGSGPIFGNLILSFAGGLIQTFEISATVAAPPMEVFRRGDANGEGKVDLSDAIFTLLWQFSTGRAPACMDAADANDDGKVNIGDPIFLLDWQFRGGPKPPSPGPRDCGPDATPDNLPACDYTSACAQ